MRSDHPRVQLREVEQRVEQVGQGPDGTVGTLDQRGVVGSVAAGGENSDQRCERLHWLPQVVTGRREKPGLLFARTFGQYTRLLQSGLSLLLGGDVDDEAYAFERF